MTKPCQNIRKQLSNNGAPFYLVKHHILDIILKYILLIYHILDIILNHIFAIYRILDIILNYILAIYHVIICNYFFF